MPMRLLIICALAGLLAACASDRPAPVSERAAVPSASADTPVHIVKRGETIYSIAREYRVEPRDLMAWNNLSDPSKLSVGQSLRLRPGAVAPAALDVATVPPSSGSAAPSVLETKSLPPPPGHATVITSPSAAPNAPPANAGVLKTQPKGVKLPYSEQNLASLQKQDAPAPVSVPATPPATVPAAQPVDATPAPVSSEGSLVKDGVEWAWPATGNIIAKFSEGGRKGVDIGGREGDPVHAAATGKVIHSGGGLRGYGNLVIIRHNAQYLSAYAHNKSIAVKQGQSVVRGQKIAELGSTGTDAPKLHFEIRHQGTPVDPEVFLPPRR